MKYFQIVIFLLISFSSNCFGQDCSNFNRWNECRLRINDYNKYLQPKSIAVGLNDTLRFNVVFTGIRDYIISFCASKLYYPVNVRFLKPGTKELIYDNAADTYSDVIGIGFNKTQNIIIEVMLLAFKLGNDRLTFGDMVCVGMVMHWKKF